MSSKFFHGRTLARIVSEGADSTGQTTLRWSILLLLALLVLAGEFGLDVVLGAFLAGAVLRRWAPGDVHSFEAKLDAVGYGFFIPVFFVAAGVGVDIVSIRESPARLVVFFVLLLVVRGLPVLFVYRRCPRFPTAIAADVLHRDDAAADRGADRDRLGQRHHAPGERGRLVGAGVLSVLVFPLVAVLLEGTRRRR